MEIIGVVIAALFGASLIVFAFEISGFNLIDKETQNVISKTIDEHSKLEKRVVTLERSVHELNEPKIEPEVFNYTIEFKNGQDQIWIEGVADIKRTEHVPQIYPTFIDGRPYERVFSIDTEGPSEYITFLNKNNSILAQFKADEVLGYFKD